ncbi:site-specific DNA-methyltransferase [Phascolarctobacterium succinatutens]|uniref:site-specific DNA-methyltransferase n=2 Tax=Phascolarctobacterium succinatutens TaxID=626940 RepID=UPI0026671504|nr:site-specific DNA-methyltransferase [Phascolarctobacterium succinatutens]
MMEHLNMQSMDKVAANVAKIRELFPNCVTERINNEGKLEHAIDFDMLKQELSDHVVDGLQERYQFTWPDKRKAILAANAPINKTLRPCREESVDFDNTENLYIEGDNLEVLKLLQETYLGKVKMIYIDPPYNTGNDFVYNDDFKQSSDEYVENSGQLDDEGNRIVANTESNGRFHTDWLNMIYPRLKIAKDILDNDGIIFISINDKEQENLKKICDEIFGNSNFIACIPRKTGAGNAAARGNAILRKPFDYILLYKKSDSCILRRKLVGQYEYKYSDDYGAYRLGQYQATGSDATRDARPSLYYPIYVDKNGKLSTVHKEDAVKTILPKKIKGEDGRWMWKPDKFNQDNNKYIYYDGERLYRKIYYDESKEQNKYQVEQAWLDGSIYQNAAGTKELGAIMNSENAVFSNPKPVDLIKWCVNLHFKNDVTVLDFFSGSATTAHAVMQLNAENGGKRKFIMVQLPEVCAENTEAYKAGYKNICEIGKERIRRAGQKIKEENPLTTQDLDIGFRVLKCDSSNMEDVYFTPKEYMDKQQSLFIDNIKKDRSDEDLLFDAMLKLDTPLSSKIEKISIAGKTVYNVAQGHLMACFDKNVTDEVITAIAKEMPSYFVMRDSSQADDSVAINFEQIFNTYSPQTVRRVL